MDNIELLISAQNDGYRNGFIHGIGYVMDKDELAVYLKDFCKSRQGFVDIDFLAECIVDFCSRRAYTIAKAGQNTE